MASPLEEHFMCHHYAGIAATLIDFILVIGAVLAMKWRSSIGLRRRGKRSSSPVAARSVLVIAMVVIAICGTSLVASLFGFVPWWSPGHHLEYLLRDRDSPR